MHAVPDCINQLTALRTVYFVQNKISHIDGFSNLGATLRSLELGGNRIRVCFPALSNFRFLTHCRKRIENLESLVNLEELWLGKNKIVKLEVSSVYVTTVQRLILICIGAAYFTSTKNLVDSVQSNHKVRGIGRIGGFGRVLH